VLLVTFAIAGISLLLHLAAARYVYIDSERYEMNRQKWTGISLLIPFFGFFAYLFERDYRTREPDDRFVTTAGFEIHESRADDIRPDPGGTDDDRRSTDDGGASPKSK